MATRVVEGKKPYTGGKAISIDENKVISLNLRDENNLIIYDEGDDEIYVDLQLDDEITPTDAFPIGVNVGRAIVDNGWDKTGTIISAVTTSGDNIKIFYADEGTLWMDNGTGTFKQIYFKADVDALLLALRTYIDGELAKKQNGVSSATAPENPVQGDQWYDTVNDELKVYDGSNWTGVGGGDVLVSDQANNIFTPGMKIWGGTESNYQSLTPDSNTAYLLLAGGPAPTGWGTITGFSYVDVLSSYTGGDVNGMARKPDGTKFYITGEQNNTVYQYSVSTPRDVTTATYDNKYVATTLNVSNSIIFSDDGLTMWIGGGWGTGYVYKWTLSTAWDVSTASYSGDTSNISFDQCTGYWMANNGQYLFVLSRGSRWIRRYTMLTPYDITTLDATYQEYSNLPNTCHKVLLNPQGTQLFYYARDDHKIHICALSTAFDLTSLSETSQYTITTPNTNDITSATIDNSGNSMWIGGYNIGGIYQYSTTTA